LSLFSRVSTNRSSTPLRANVAAVLFQRRRRGMAVVNVKKPPGKARNAQGRSIAYKISFLM